jgi:uncharacterized RmlC-like cupin family protein
MAKASTGRATPAKVKAAPPAVVRKKAKTDVVAPKKQAAAKKAPVKAPKMVAAPRKSVSAKAPAPKRGGVKAKASMSTKAPVSKKAPASKKAATKAARKAAPPVKTIAVKKAAARRSATRIAVPTPAPRRARAAAAPRKVAASAPPAKASVNPPQVFTVSHLNQGGFKTDGLRTYAQYRDLGIAAATGGLCQAHVIRFTPPCTDEVRKRHTHQADLQLIYVLQGWMKNEFEGHGEQMMSAGSCWLQPSGIKHTVLDYSADCEVLEIIVPADFKTEELT